VSKAKSAKRKAQQAKKQLSSAGPSSRTGGGLKAAGSVVSKQEFKNIMSSRDISANKLLERIGEGGLALGSAAVKALNKGKFGSVGPLGTPSEKFIEGPGGYGAGLKGLSLSRGQVYAGTYGVDGKQMPIIQARQAVRRPAAPQVSGKSEAPAGQTDYGIRPMSEEERKVLTSSGSTPRWIPNLNAPGTENYDPEYGGGGWVSTKGVPGGTGMMGAASDEFMKAYSKATTMAKQLGQMGTGGSVEGVYNLAKMFDERQAQQPTAGLTGYSQPTQAGTAGESVAPSGGKVQKLRSKIQKTKALIKSSQSELAARGF